MTYLLLLILTCSAVVEFGKSHPDEILNLPGLNYEINFKQYSGYLDATPGKYLFYWFVESQRAPVTDPLVLWLNGGPGCSSLGGILTENGPFNVDPNGTTLSNNPYSWNRVANVIYLESPAGVGFSYAANRAVITDGIVAEENYAALLNFFIKFPQFKKNEFHIMGESYAGVYVPMLSVLVLDRSPDINFKGFVIGNGCLDVILSRNSQSFFAYYHGLIDTEEWSSLITLCCEPNSIPFGCNFQRSSKPMCLEKASEIFTDLYLSELNLYNIYDKCFKTANMDSRYAIDQERIFEVIKGKSKDMSVGCIDYPNLPYYLNQPAVRQALHAPVDFKKWAECSQTVHDDYQEVYYTMKDNVLHLLNSGKVRGLIYNGDVDMVCNFLGNEWFTELLALDVVKPKAQWRFEDQVAGYVTYYKDFIFLTVKGSGHMVPTDKPGPALKMISNYLDNVSI